MKSCMLKPTFWKRNKGFGVLIAFILTAIMWYMIIIQLSEPCPDCNCYYPQTNEVYGENAKVMFEFEDKYFRVFDNELNLLDFYNNKTIDLPTGYIESIEYVLDNSENFTTFCVEYAVNHVDSSLNRVEPPEELYLISPKYRVDCYDIGYLSELRDYLLIEQEYSDVEDSIIKFTLWKE